jgi:hypothetical protein
MLVSDTAKNTSDDTSGNTDDAKDEERMEDDDLPTCMLWRQSKARVSLVSMQHLPMMLQSAILRTKNKAAVHMQPGNMASN